MFSTFNTNWSCSSGYSTSNICKTDNSNFTVWRESTLSATGSSNVGAVLNARFDTTDLTVTYVDAPVYEGSAETDAIFQANNDIPANLAALAWCNDAISSLTCDQHYARFRSNTPSQALACHEAGHTVGLTHGNDAWPAVGAGNNVMGCLQNPPPDSNGGELGTHNREMIDVTY